MATGTRGQTQQQPQPSFSLTPGLRIHSCRGKNCNLYKDLQHSTVYWSTNQVQHGEPCFTTEISLLHCPTYGIHQCCAKDDYQNEMVFGEENEMVFGGERLLEITPDHFARHLKKMAYGTPTPGPQDTPVHYRSSVQSSDHDAFSVSHHRTKEKRGKVTRFLKQLAGPIYSRSLER
jgi:hypothetical protein